MLQEELKIELSWTHMEGLIIYGWLTPHATLAATHQKLERIVKNVTESWLSTGETLKYWWFSF